jgi:hypothetical protein
VRFTVVVDGKPAHIKPPTPRAGAGGDGPAGHGEAKGPDDSVGIEDLGETTHPPTDSAETPAHHQPEKH